jgi:DNA polymerase III subunit epsilon
VHFVVVDIETTGGSPKTSKITEIALYKTDGTQILDEYVTLINPEIPIPEFIVRLTGINDKMVETAPKFYEVAKKIIEFTQDCIFVAHNVAFDYGMIRGEFRSLGYDFRLPHLCTVRASRYMFPGHDSYSLGKLARALGIEIQGRHRAGGDALATTIIFNQLFEKSFKNLEKFIQHEINPKSLHPNLDVNFLDELPNKTGVYKFFNETNQLIYIGKSKHIKKRVDQHLKNNSTKKGIQMQQEVCRIDFELTGSELVALLLESHLIKKHKPIYNRQLRKELFPYGLFSYENEMAYKELYIDRISKKTEHPLTTFSTKADGVAFLERECASNILCQKLCHIYQTKTSCFAYEVKQCFGACIQKESSETYNARVNALLDNLAFDFKNVFILEKGIQNNEKTIVLIENGSYRGYGTIPFYGLKKPKQFWFKYIEYYHEDKDARTIIQSYLRKNDRVEVVEI